MNSGSEQKLSMDELMALNRPLQVQPELETPPPVLPPIEIHCPLPEAVEHRMESLENLNSWQTEYLKRLSEMPCDYPSRSQMDELLKSVKHLEQMVEQAGKQKEKSFYLPRFRMPYIPWGSLLLWSAMLLIIGAVLWAMWYSSATLWNAIKPLFQ